MDENCFLEEKRLPNDERTLNLSINNTVDGTAEDVDFIYIHDNLIAVVSETVRNAIEITCYIFLTPLFCMIGIQTNIINCLVFRRQGLKDRMNLYLFSLALSDICYLVCALLIYTLGDIITRLDENIGEQYYSKFIMNFVSVLHGFKTTSSCITMVVAVERCLCVINPLRVSLFIKTRTVALLLCLCLFFFQGCYLVTPFSFKAILEKAESSVMWTIASTGLYDENLLYICFIFVGTIVPIVSFMVISIATVLTVLRLKAAFLWRKTSGNMTGNNDSQQVSLTTMLVIVSCVYVITTLPTIAQQLFFTFYLDCARTAGCYNVYMALQAIAFSLALVNNAFYFFIYFRRSSKFRFVLGSLNCCFEPKQVCHSSTAG